MSLSNAFKSTQLLSQKQQRMRVSRKLIPADYPARLHWFGRQNIDKIFTQMK